MGESNGCQYLSNHSIVLQGAKQFFKKMYNSATLPSKKKSVSNGSMEKEEREEKEKKNDPL